MLSGLILTAFLMGLGGIPHCAAMCGAPCAVAFPRGLPWLSLLGRCLGYAMLGAVAAASAGAVASLGREVAFLKPLWMMLLAAAIMLGLCLLRFGRMPEGVNEAATALYKKVRNRWVGPDARSITRPVKPMLPLLAGMAWTLMPCGLLYAALMVAVLAPTAWGGGLVMLAFAVPGAFGVWAAPALLGRLARLARAKQADGGGKAGAVKSEASASQATLPKGGLALTSTQGVPVTWFSREMSLSGTTASKATMAGASTSRPARGSQAGYGSPEIPFDPRWAVRVSGLMLASMAGWALYHQLWAQWQIWCA